MKKYYFQMVSGDMCVEKCKTTGTFIGSFDCVKCPHFIGQGHDTNFF